jgi:hypothetical protein
VSWARVDDGWWSHPKVLATSLTARGLWVSALSWSCQHRSADVPRALVAMLGSDDATAGELVAVGLWVETDAGWRIHDWDDYRDRTLSEKRADAGRKGGIRSGQTRSKRASKTTAAPSANDPETASDQREREPTGTSVEATERSNDEATGEAGTRPVPSRPDPTVEPADPSDDDVVEQFEAFWSVYPARNGRKVGKGNALIEWRKLTLDQRRRAFVGARHLAASDALPKDPERFLRRAKGGKGDYPFDDWQTPPSVDSRRPGGDDLRAVAAALREQGR